MSLLSTDIAGEIDIERNGYECELCSWQSHEVRRRYNSDGETRCLCNDCNSRIESQIYEAKFDEEGELV